MRLQAVVFSILLVSPAFSGASGFPEYDDRITLKPRLAQNTDLVQVPPEATQDHKISRYLVFGRGAIDDIAQNQASSVSDSNGFFSIAVLPEQSLPSLYQKGYDIVKDLELEFHAEKTAYSEMDQIRKATGSELAYVQYNYTGAGITIAIVDTGVDFSNPDVRHSLARDHNNYPIMLDPDGQGLVITNATFIAKINDLGQIENATKKFIEEKNRSLSKNATSTVYVTKNGAFLNLKQQRGTQIQIYNSFFPTLGPSPTFNGTITDDYKIGKSSRDYIRSASGVYHFGIIYQGAMQGPFASVQAVPVLVVDSQTPGVYDTVIPDLSTSWMDYTKFTLKKGEKPKYDFDFTDEPAIRLGAGNEFLVYDSDKDGKPDYSAGTVGAQVLDIYGVIAKTKPAVDKILKATNGTLLAPIDPAGNYFGVMSDFVGHGTAAAASITSKGKEKYDIYNNTKKYTLPGVAPNAKIIPVKALWFGDTVYGWLWAAGFDNNSTWKFSGKPRADIISNSWGLSTFPSLNTAPGIDILSIITSILATPQSLDERYPGVVVVSSAGNAGHGYGTIGLPNAAPLGIAVGATTNNVYVGYGQFKGQPRFGNTTIYANDMADFSSRGPSVIGDPKPDLVNTGAYGFVPGNVIKAKKDSKQEPFVLFGGTSMAAPLVAGSGAILMEGLRQKNQDYDPFMIKNILMSTATDLGNDPFTQGAGHANAYKAVQFVDGKGGVFAVYNDATYKNVKEVLDIPILKVNSTAIGLGKFELPDRAYPQTSWFAGRLAPGERGSAYFTIENPGNQTIAVQITPQKLQLVQKTELNSTTRLQLKDPLYNKTGVFRPDYIRLEDIKKHDSLASYYENVTIPRDSELLVMNLNFAFSDFMNKTEKMYAADTKIASLYLYDWNDKNGDKAVSSDELSMVNRGGTWGTVQELRVSEPGSKFKNVPLAGIYAVPTRYSYWAGDTKKNSTEMNYSLTASHYKKEVWSDVWLDSGLVEVKPHSTAKVHATVTIPDDARPGIYQGFVTFVGQNHTANAPVSYAVSLPVTKKDALSIIPGNKNQEILYGSGYVKGAFDMVNRYNAGDWRQYYFDIRDPTINAASIEISWKDQDTNFSVFVIDPHGRLVQTNMPPGVFGHLMNWPTSDWLGTSLFSEGGGFYPVKNKDQTSTVLYAPINQTGTYSLLLHSTLFGGQKTTEPFTLVAQFSTILADHTAPQITWDISEFTNGLTTPHVSDDGKFSARHWLDGTEIIFENDTLVTLEEGPHQLRIEAADSFGNISEKTYSFVLDRTAPQIIINSANNTATSDELVIDYTVLEENLAETTILLPNGTTLQNKTHVKIDTSEYSEGKYGVVVSAKDRAENSEQKTIVFYVGEAAPSPARPAAPEPRQDSNLVLLAIIGVAAIGGASLVAIIAKKSKNQRKFI